MVELVDTLDSKSGVHLDVPVQVRLAVPHTNFKVLLWRRYACIVLNYEKTLRTSQAYQALLIS
jgi:hypothetical protein